MSYKISTIFSNKFDTNLQTQYITFWYTWEGMFLLPTPTISACITHVGNDERKWRRRTWSSVSTKRKPKKKKKKIFVYDISHPCVYKVTCRPSAATRFIWTPSRNVKSESLLIPLNRTVHSSSLIWQSTRGTWLMATARFAILNPVYKI